MTTIHKSIALALFVLCVFGSSTTLYALKYVNLLEEPTPPAPPERPVALDAEGLKYQQNVRAWDAEIAKIRGLLASDPNSDILKEALRNAEASRKGWVDLLNAHIRFLRDQRYRHLLFKPPTVKSNVPNVRPTLRHRATSTSSVHKRRPSKPIQTGSVPKTHPKKPMQDCPSC